MNIAYESLPANVQFILLMRNKNEPLIHAFAKLLKEALDYTTRTAPKGLAAPGIIVSVLFSLILASYRQLGVAPRIFRRGADSSDEGAKIRYSEIFEKFRNSSN